MWLSVVSVCVCMCVSVSVHVSVWGVGVGVAYSVSYMLVHNFIVYIHVLNIAHYSFAACRAYNCLVFVCPHSFNSFYKPKLKIA